MDVNAGWAVTGFGEEDLAGE
uniref:Uncharacterized protein n=1 Tax=Arundo donax TaxID=35708 RepID=A0A0A9C576_ARUDO